MYYLNGDIGIIRQWCPSKGSSVEGDRGQTPNGTVIILLVYGSPGEVSHTDVKSGILRTIQMALVIRVVVEDELKDFKRFFCTRIGYI